MSNEFWSVGLHYMTTPNEESVFSNVTDPSRDGTQCLKDAGYFTTSNPLTFLWVSLLKIVKLTDYCCSNKQPTVTPWWSHAYSAFTIGWENSTSLINMVGAVVPEGLCVTVCMTSGFFSPKNLLVFG